MNHIEKWNPLREWDDLSNKLSHYFGHKPAPVGAGKEAMSVAQWAPLVDIAEDDKGFIIKAELPEVKKEDITVSVDNGVLTLTGERRFEKEEKDDKKTFHRVERSYGRFSRSFTLPEGADDKLVTAEHRDGVLNIRVPKAAKPAAKAVNVKVS